MAISLLGQIRNLAAVTPPTYPADTVVLFAPRDQVQRAVEVALGFATVSLKVAMFALTDPAVNAILHAKASAAGFEFQMSLDSSQATTNPKMGPVVASWVGDPRVKTGTSARGNYSHLKTAVVDHLYVVSGSTNWTLSGELYEDNELVVRRHAPLAAWYERQLDAVFARMT